MAPSIDLGGLLQARADLLMRELTGVRTIHLALFSRAKAPAELQAEVDAGRVQARGKGVLPQRFGPGG